MYIFVRFTAIVLMILGVILMLVGLATGISGAVRIFEMPVQAPLPGMPGVTLFANLFVAGIIFLQGLIIIAIGQLMVVFVDIARNTGAMAEQLRGVRLREG